MADNYKYINASGLILPDTSELMTDIEGEFKEAFGDDLVITPESPEGVLIAVETEARDSLVRNNAQVANQINPDYASGVFLDAIAALTGLKRNGGVASTVKAQLAGVAGTGILAGARAATGAGDVFYSREDLVLDSSGQGELFFYSEALGAVPAPSGTLTEILDGGVLGWETINNAEAATLGRAEEKDAPFRKRREDTLFLQGVALPGAIVSGLMTVEGVQSVAFIENTASTEQVISNVTMPPHCIYCVVDGSTDAEVADMLLQKKSLGCNMKGAVEVATPDPVTGQVYTVRFDRPEYRPLRARFTVRVLGAVTVDPQGAVRAAVVDYANDLIEGLRGLRVGAAASPFEMSVAIGTRQPAIFVLKAEVGNLDEGVAGLGTETLLMELWQKATITEGSIDVVVVNG